MQQGLYERFWFPDRVSRGCLRGRLWRSRIYGVVGIDYRWPGFGCVVLVQEINMRLCSSGFGFVVLAIVLALVGASPLPFRWADVILRSSSTLSLSRETLPTSPHIFCEQGETRTLCEKFEVPIRHPHIQGSHETDRFSDTIMGHGYLIPPDEQQIQRIMEVKVDVHNAEAQRPWDIPDVQVVLWFILLCCLAEGIVVGVRW